MIMIILMVIAAIALLVIGTLNEIEVLILIANFMEAYLIPLAITVNTIKWVVNKVKGESGNGWHSLHK